MSHYQTRDIDFNWTGEKFCPTSHMAVVSTVLPSARQMKGLPRERTLYNLVIFSTTVRHYSIVRGHMWSGLEEGGMAGQTRP